MKRLFKYLYLHYCAAQAMRGIISNDKLYSAVITLAIEEVENGLNQRDRETVVKYIISKQAFTYAKEMVDKVK